MARRSEKADIEKERAGKESFWLSGPRGVAVKPSADGEDAGRFRASVQGFDYYNTRTGNALWTLDPDYDRRSLFPRQVFFPMATARDAWKKLSRKLSADIDTGLVEAYRGTVPLPFEAGEHEHATVKVVELA